MLEKLRVITRLFAPQPTLPLGRWRLKHDFDVCDAYLTNSYGDPGYPNIFKNEWIKTLEEKNGVNKIESSRVTNV